VKSFSFRAVAPIFHIDPFKVCGKMTGKNTVTLWAEKAGGALCMDATASIA
jgi:3-methylfumaryl-CoA hydratase